MEKITYKSLYEKCCANLDFVVQPLVAEKITSSKPFQEQIRKQLCILSFLEKKAKIKSGQAKKIVEKYTEIVKSEPKLDYVPATNDLNNLSDEINFLPVFVQNVFKTPIEKISSAATTPKIDQPAPEQAPNPTSPMFGQFNQANLNKQIVMSMAQARVMQEASMGKVYIYKTKPKIMPILKLCIGIVLVLGSIFSVLMAVGIILSPNMYGTPPPDGVQFNSITYFLIAIMLIFNSFNYFSQWIKKGTKKQNDNLLYHFSFFNSMFMLITIAIFFIFGGIEDFSKIFEKHSDLSDRPLSG